MESDRILYREIYWERIGT